MTNSRRTTMRMAALLALTGLMVSFGPAHAQLSGRDIAKSLVRITVEGGTTSDGKPRNPGFASGFVWQNNLQVVTSLHAMRPGSGITIKVEWGDFSQPAEKRGPWIATVDKVYEKADLVLLKVDPGRLGAPEWTALTSTVEGKPDDKVVAMGFYRNAEKWKKMTLSISETADDRLVMVLPQQIAKEIRDLGVPDPELAVHHFESNSLLPGYSGGPIMNPTAKALVAIATGGLQKGTVNWSWGIPAKHLAELEKSTVTAVPANVASADKHYSSEEAAIVSSTNNSLLRTTPVADAQAYQDARLDSIGFGDYEFYYLGTNTLGDMLPYVDNPDAIHDLLGGFLRSFMGLQDEAARDAAFSDLEEMFVFDLYQDINHGIVIATPTGATLEVDTELERLWVDFGDDDVNSDFVMEYEYERDEEEGPGAHYLNDPENLLNMYTQILIEDNEVDGRPIPSRDLSSGMRYPNGGLVNFFYEIYHPGNDGPYSDALRFDKLAVEEDVYLTASLTVNAFNKSTAMAMEHCLAMGVSCTDLPEGSECENVCEVLYTTFYLITAVHLTTFQSFANQEGHPIAMPEDAVTPVEEESAPEPEAIVENVWVQHDVQGQDGSLGMVVNARLNLTGYQGVPFSAWAAFGFDGAAGIPDVDGLYTSPEGQVASTAQFTPEYESTLFEAFQIFLPYSQLHLAPGQYQLNVLIALWDMQNGEFVTVSEPVPFSYTQY